MTDSPPSLSGAEWLDRFASSLHTDAPDAATIETLLDLAGAAAHGSERIAAPIACYLVGRVGMDPAAALEVARLVAIEAIDPIDPIDPIEDAPGRPTDE